jgi:transposase
LIAGSAELQLLDDLLARFKERGLLKSRRRQRTDSTHVLDAVRDLNRLEPVAETMRAALIMCPKVLRNYPTSDVSVGQCA